MTTRRAILKSFIVASASWLAVAKSGFSQTVTLPPTPECKDGDEPTPRQTAGPFYKPQAPKRSSLVEPKDTQETQFLLTGQVLSLRCKPLAGAMIEIWHADAKGGYDNIGFRYRGHMFADEGGRFSVQTIMPGRYPGRTPHFHIRVQPPGGRILTTQLYFPGEDGNRRDFLFQRDLLLDVKNTPQGLAGHYVFAVEA